MIIFTEIGIQLHVLTEIMHPSHIPLKAEVQAAFVNRPCNERPCGGFLRNCHNSGEGPSDDGVKMLEKFYGLQILVAAEFIGHPFAVFFAIIQIKHGSHGIHTQAVNMEFFNPEKSIGNQEIFYLVFAIVENLGAPVRMLSQSWIGMFKKRFPVKLRESVGILGKMRGHPVKDHTDFIAVKGINQVCKILRRPIAGGRRIISCHLIPPGTVKGMLCNTHQLHMGKFHFLKIADKTIRKLPVIIKTVLRPVRMLHPGADMTFIDSQRFPVHILSRTFLHPYRICPFKMGNIRGNGSCARPFFRIVGKRVRFVKLTAVRRGDQKLIHLSRAYSGNKKLINSSRTLFFHWVLGFLPSVEGTENMYLQRMRRPDSKKHSLLSVLHGRVGPQFFVDVIMCPLCKQILIGLGDKNLRCFFCLCYTCHLYLSSAAIGGLDSFYMKSPSCRIIISSSSYRFASSTSIKCFGVLRFA